ncbi:hypothetical protein PFICI_11283 [Pestalotiopsis fici W106-1]|uniref:Major facilitator superfamily (MFS) profile domain-containing protein n=1 Tax=Pestalotiopsis fici (strain W106-1 / CGMCC3.15140) TaxID=1229662 RepID=W3WUD1_PESFW|nr:uncharacterized protein PFICI_11283 [Pestalotiopsis fici W106-1]ETS77409.1 hypothetical protein PFICI_11283 [Pestalotiopsis fici W106-1]
MVIMLDELHEEVPARPGEICSDSESKLDSGQDDRHTESVVSTGSECKTAGMKRELTPEVQAISLAFSSSDTAIQATSEAAGREKEMVDPNLVGWDGQDDPLNPKNWKSGKRWAATLVMSSFTFITPVASSMVAPAFDAIGAEFHIVSEIELSLMLSIFILAYAVGPLFLGPLSEIYGRVIVLQLSNFVFLVFNLGCGLATSRNQMLAFRFLSGLGGSAPLALGAGVLSDLFDSHERGKAVSIYSLAPLLGPAIGPIAGGFIVAKVSWRWIFHATTIVDAVVQIAGFFLLQETYPPVLLNRKRMLLVKETGNLDLYTALDYANRSVWETLQISLTRPFILLFTQPIVQVLAVYVAYLFGLMYLLLSTFPKLWQDRYDETVSIAGLNYISLGLGFFLGTQICAPLQDRIFRKLKCRNGGVGQPEFRVPLMVPAALMVPIGLFWYGWAAQAHTHWIVPNIGTTVAAAGIYLGFLCIQTYIVDTYSTYAASAIAATIVLRSLAGFGLPLFAPYMYKALDYGWGNTVLGLLAIVLGWPAPILLWKYGRMLRERSTFATG